MQVLCIYLIKNHCDVFQIFSTCTYVWYVEGNKINWNWKKCTRTTRSTLGCKSWLACLHSLWWVTQSESTTLNDSWLSPTCFNPVDHFRWKELFTRFTLVVWTALINLGTRVNAALRVWAASLIHTWRTTSSSGISIIHDLLVLLRTKQSRLSDKRPYQCNQWQTVFSVGARYSQPMKFRSVELTVSCLIWSYSFIMLRARCWLWKVTVSRDLIVPCLCTEKGFSVSCILVLCLVLTVYT
jgi:hypothetical protein